MRNNERRGKTKGGVRRGRGGIKRRRKRRRRKAKSRGNGKKWKLEARKGERGECEGERVRACF